MIVTISSRAKTDLAEYLRLIAYEKPLAARKWLAEIQQAIAALPEFPRMGRIVPEYGDENIRELIKGNYRIVYTIAAAVGVVAILTIHHSKKLMR